MAGEIPKQFETEKAASDDASAAAASAPTAAAAVQCTQKTTTTTTACAAGQSERSHCSPFAPATRSHPCLPAFLACRSQGDVQKE